MEEDLITEARGVPPLIFKPTYAFYGSNDTIKNMLYENGKIFIFFSSVNLRSYFYLKLFLLFVPYEMLIELVQVQMILSNPLNISLCIENLSLTYAFDEGLILVEPQVLDELLLAPSSTTQVIFIY